MARRPGRATAPVIDRTFGDRALAEAREDVVMGRWEGARELLAGGARRDWDRRALRFQLLAEAASSRRTVDFWQAAEPRNPDVLILRAATEVNRSFAAAAGGAAPAQGELDRVARICVEAAEAAPEDPQPWVSLVALSRLYPGGHAHLPQCFAALRARDPFHREGHHQALRYLSARWHGSHAQAYEFAWDAALAAPAGSPLAVLPLVARAEHYRHERETRGQGDVNRLHHWDGQRALHDLDGALRAWIAQRTTVHAQDVADLNLLAHALVHAGRLLEAAPVFALLHNQATRSPWVLTAEHESPTESFARWRDRALTQVDRNRNGGARRQAPRRT